MYGAARTHELAGRTNLMRVLAAMLSQRDIQHTAQRSIAAKRGRERHSMFVAPLVAAGIVTLLMLADALPFTRNWAGAQTVYAPGGLFIHPTAFIPPERKVTTY